jgi:hypothetical protein
MSFNIRKAQPIEKEFYEEAMKGDSETPDGILLSVWGSVEGLSFRPDIPDHYEFIEVRHEANVHEGYFCPKRTTVRRSKDEHGFLIYFPKVDK